MLYQGLLVLRSMGGGLASLPAPMMLRRIDERKDPVLQRRIESRWARHWIESYLTGRSTTIPGTVLR